MPSDRTELSQWDSKQKTMNSSDVFTLTTMNITDLVSDEAGDRNDARCVARANFVWRRGTRAPREEA